MTTTFLDTWTHGAAPCLTAVSTPIGRWTRPLTRTLVGGTLADATRSRRVLLAENALLRQQLLVLQRQIKRPTLTPGERLRLVLLARLTRTWPSAS